MGKYITKRSFMDKLINARYWRTEQKYIFVNFGVCLMRETLNLEYKLHNLYCVYISLTH